MKHQRDIIPKQETVSGGVAPLLTSFIICLFAEDKGNCVEQIFELSLPSHSVQCTVSVLWPVFW